MSIPFLLGSGEAFPERDLIILIAGGVIVVSLTVTSFILPLSVSKKKSNADEVAENEAYPEILQNVITELQSKLRPKMEWQRLSSRQITVNGTPTCNADSTAVPPTATRNDS